MSDQGKGMSDLWKRLRFVFVAILVYRIGTHIPIPGIDPDSCLLYTSPSPRDAHESRMPSSA